MVLLLKSSSIELLWGKLGATYFEKYSSWLWCITLGTESSPIRGGTKIYQITSRGNWSLQQLCCCVNYSSRKKNIPGFRILSLTLICCLTLAPSFYLEPLNFLILQTGDTYINFPGLWKLCLKIHCPVPDTHIVMKFPSKKKKLKIFYGK